MEVKEEKEIALQGFKCKCGKEWFFHSTIDTHGKEVPLGTRVEPMHDCETVQVWGYNKSIRKHYVKKI